MGGYYLSSLVWHLFNIPFRLDPKEDRKTTVENAVQVEQPSSPQSGPETGSHDN